MFNVIVWAEVTLEIEGSSSKDRKGLFSYKNTIKGHFRFEQPMFLKYLHCFCF